MSIYKPTSSFQAYPKNRGFCIFFFWDPVHSLSFRENKVHYPNLCRAMLILRDINTLWSARGIGEWGWLSQPCCWNKHFYSRTDSRNLTTIPYTMAIVGGEAVREEQANGLICCVNKRMSVKALQWHVSVALGMEKGLETSMWSCLVWLWSFLKRRCMVDRKNVCRKQNNGATTEVSPSYIYPSAILKKCCKQRQSLKKSSLWIHSVVYRGIYWRRPPLSFITITIRAGISAATCLPGTSEKNSRLFVIVLS